MNRIIIVTLMCGAAYLAGHSYLITDWFTKLAEPTIRYNEDMQKIKLQNEEANRKYLRMIEEYNRVKQQDDAMHEQWKADKVMTTKDVTARLNDGRLVSLADCIKSEDLSKRIKGVVGCSTAKAYDTLRK